MSAPGPDLAVTRTQLALERTQMAWVRTSTSLISFGFTIYKFFQYLRENNPPPSQHLIGPRGFAMTMITIGVVALFVTTLEHRKQVHALAAQAGPQSLVKRSFAGILSWAVCLLGLLGLALTVFRQ